jgi:hypothetical protein
MRPSILSLMLACLACGIPQGTPAGERAPARWGSYSFDLVDEAGRVLPTFSHQGRTYVLGSVGRRYQIRVRNDSGRRVEVVVSVDGRDVMDGGPSALARRGYLVDGHSDVTIDGYRLSQGSVAAFRFGTVPRSYAALEGDPRDVGVIGVAVFPEREPAWAPYRSREAGEKADRHGPQSPAPAAPEAPAGEAPRSSGVLAEKRPGLGTEFGEERPSPVRQVFFERARPRPDVVLSLRYDDRAGLLAAGVDVDGRRSCEAATRQGADPFRRDGGFAPPPAGWSPSRGTPPGA